MFDSHTHLNDEAFSADLDAVLQRAAAAGVERMLVVGYTLAASRRAVELAHMYPGQLYAAVGIHPHDAAGASDKVLQQLEDLCRAAGVVAVGETGLDYYYEHTPRKLQQQVFQQHLDLSRKAELPVIVHSRDAAQDTMDIIAAADDVRCLLHCYSGSLPMAEEYVRRGHYISFGGPLTFRNARNVRAVAAALGSERLLLETDCPYLAPEPKRGQRNEPAFLPYTAAKLAELHNCSFEQLVAETVRNTERLFALSCV